MTISRTYQDPAGTRWNVMQWLVGSRPTVPPVPALIFSTRGGSTQVRDFPRDWMTLPDEELERLRSSAAA
ncbi:MAG TPA: hypothetical protein VGE02_09765 [Gemmatimonadales bacterium]